MTRRIRSHACLGLALLAALLQTLATPLAHGRVARASLEVCTAQGVRSAPADAPAIPAAASEHEHCALCVHPGAAGVPASRFVLPVSAPDRTTPRLDEDSPRRASLPFALRDARAPPAALAS